MYIFIDTISPIGKLILHKDSRIISEKDLNILGKEYADFLDVLLGFLDENDLDISDLDGITVVNGPGGFTGTRIIALVLNTIQFMHKTKIQKIDYFTLLEKAHSPYPMAIRANRTEYLLKESKDAKPIIVHKAELKNGIYSGIGEKSDFENADISIKSDIDYDAFIAETVFGGDDARVEPYYIKKPNIT